MPSHTRDIEDREEGEMVDEDDGDGDHERTAVSRKRHRSESETEESDDSSHAHKRKKAKKEKKHKKSKKRKKEKKEKRSEHSHRSSRHRRDNPESNSDVIDVDRNDDNDDDAATDREDACSTPELPEMEEEIELEKAPVAQAVKSSISPPSSSSRKPHKKLEEVDDTPKKDRRRRSRSPAGRSHTRSAPRASEGPSEKPAKASYSQNKRGEVENNEPESSKSVLSLSIEETNKLREKLGMAPLKVNGAETSKPSSESEEKERQRKEELAAKEGGTLIAESKHSLEVHRPPKNMREKTLAEKLRERIAQRKQKREHEVKMALVKKLGEASDDEDNAVSWVERQKRAQQEKEAAAKRQKMLDDLDDEFGVASIVEEESKKERDSQYRRNNLAGLKVEHSAEKFAEGRSVILTLKDSNILDEEDEDTLVNVNIVDDERATKKIDDTRKAKVGYNAYDQEDVDDMTGEVRKKNMLAKYDEEIDGAQKTSFRIGDSGEYNEEAQLQRERDRVRQKLAMKRTMESLESAQPRIASDYYTHDEVLQFKKPKKKKKKAKSTRKSMLKADDLLAMGGENPLPDSFGSRNRSKAKAEETASASNRGALPMDVDEDEGFSVKIEHGTESVKMEPLEDDNVDFQDVLKRAKKLRDRRGAAADLADQLLAESKTTIVKEEADDHEDASGSAFIATFDDDAEAQSRIILNETAEFCRNLGARSLSGGDEFWRSSAPGPSGYGAAESGAGAEVSRDILEFEDSLKSRSTRQYEELRQERGKWSKVGDPDAENSSDDGENMDVGDNDDDDGEETKKATILDEEPDLQQGVASAIKLATNKGYWEKDDNKSGGTKLSHLLAQNYTIEDKLKMREDDRSNRRERYSGGPSQPFSEKSGYIPNVQLEYIDDSGRLLNSKEAFRYLSHKFHGKGSGKMKTEKRMKKVMEEGLMKNMSSTDTPLQTLEKLKKRQKECATPYLVLTGNKINPQDLKK